MKEDFLHFIWQFQKFSKHELVTTDGEPVLVLRPGVYNHVAGPDFFNARVKIGDTVWVGHVEIHTESKLWFAHQHQDDPKYQSVILHVVLHDNGGKTSIPTLELDQRIPQYLIGRYEQLMHAPEESIPCASSINQVDSFTWLQCKDRRLIERLEYKTNQIAQGLEQTDEHWQQVFYEQIAYNFGLATNGEAFKKLAQLLPLKVLSKHRQNLFQIEALLFGVSGLLEKYSDDEYAQELQQEFDFLQAKYKLSQLSQVEWNFGRVRPPSLPTIRIAQFAALISRSQALFSELMETTDLNQITQLFDIEPSSYWQSHYVFGKESSKKTKALGKQFLDNLLINTVLPTQFIFGKRKNKEDLIESVIDNFKKLQSEQNKIIKMWRNLGVESESAFDSQALIHQYKQYCLQKKCLDCVIGTTILSI